MGEKKKREEGQERRVRRRTGRDAGQNAQPAGACARGWGRRWGRARREGRKGRPARARDPPAGRPAGPRTAPRPTPPPRGPPAQPTRPGAPRLAPGAGPRSAGQRPVQRSPPGRACQHCRLPRKGGKTEIRAKSQRRVEKGTGNDRVGEGAGRLEEQAPREGPADPEVKDTRGSTPLPLQRLGPGWRSPCARGSRWRSRVGGWGDSGGGTLRAVSCAPWAQVASTCPHCTKSRC